MSLRRCRMSDPLPPALSLATDAIGALVRAGRHDEAAALCEAQGDLAQAASLYEKLWAFDKAWPLAERLGDLPRAARLALEAKNATEARRIAERVPADDKVTLLRVSEAFSGRGHFDFAAQLAARAGDLGRAAELYRRAGLPIAAAEALIAKGSLQDAASLLQNVIATGGGTSHHNAAEAAQAHWVLGKLMARLGRLWDAARAFQVAVKHTGTQVQAGRTLCGVLLDLGLPHAAAEVTRRLHALAPDLPATAEAMAWSVPADAVPQRFVVQRLLGNGGTGRVFLATDRLLHRDVALKVLSVGAVGLQEQALAHFLREAEAAGRLNHNNIVALHDVDVASGLLVFEYLPGGSLADVLALGQALPLAKVRLLALDVLDALSAAHDAGIVHRDVKPANIFFDAAGNAKLGDFGAAHLLDFGQTQTGGLIGTLAYLSPEQVTGARIGPTADLYALAATLFECITGRPPFLGPDFVTQHLAETPLSPSALLPLSGNATLQAVDRVLLRALRKSPEDRYPSARAMSEEIRLWPTEAALATQAQAAPTLQINLQEERAPTTASKVGESAGGVLWLRHEPRTDRNVIVWTPRAALSAKQLEAWRRVAALGGPHVQRVLFLAGSTGAIGEEVTFECMGRTAPGTPAGSVSFFALQARLCDLLGAATGTDNPQLAFVQTVSGPVWLVQPDVSDDQPAGA